MPARDDREVFSLAHSVEAGQRRLRFRSCRQHCQSAGRPSGLVQKLASRFLHRLGQAYRTSRNSVEQIRGGLFPVKP